MKRREISLKKDVNWSLPIKPHENIFRLIAYGTNLVFYIANPIFKDRIFINTCYVEKNVRN